MGLFKPVFDLIGSGPPSISGRHRRKLQALEEKYRTELPGAVWEWYSYRNAFSLLSQLHEDNVAGWDDLEVWEPCRYVSAEGTESEYGITEEGSWYFKNGWHREKCSPSRKYLRFYWENQGCYQLLLPLDQGDDPPVMFNNDCWNPDQWSVAKPSFSRWVFDTISYHLYDPYYARTLQWNAVTDWPPSDLATLRKQFQEGPRSKELGTVNYRFFNSQALIWIIKKKNRKGKMLASWRLAADTLDGMIQLGIQLKACKFFSKVHSDERHHAATAALSCVRGGLDFSEVPEEVKTSRAQWHANRAHEWIEWGEDERAIRDYEQALLINEDPTVMIGLALHLCRCRKKQLRDGERAIRLSQSACAMRDYKHGFSLCALAAGYAESGDFKLAQYWQERANRLLNWSGSRRAQLIEVLDGYKSGKALHLTDPKAKTMTAHYNQLDCDSLSGWTDRRFGQLY